MRHDHLARTGLFVSRMCFGTMNFGPDIETHAAAGKLEPSEAEPIFAARSKRHDPMSKGAVGSAVDQELRAGLPILGFGSAASFRAWLEARPRISKGMWLKLARKNSGLVSPTRAEAVDAALCHGWIDGQQDRYDETSWLVRFTPRKRASRWSQINRTRAIELVGMGLVRSAGLAEIEAARADSR